MCSATGTTCASASTLITCSKDPQDCLYAAQSTCTNGACSGAAGTAACCTNACTSGTTQCVTGASLQTCAVDTSTGCTAFSAAACTGGTVCERFAPATCADPNWAEWPMPSGAVDVAGGAGNPQGYHDNNDGTITDTVTGLMWQSAVAPGTYTQPGAVTYCAATLSLASYHDWRLPTLMELVSIVDYTGTSSSHTLLPTTLAGGQYWTSTPVGNTDYVNGSPKMAWYIDFGSGVTENTQTTTTSLVRCVR